MAKRSKYPQSFEEWKEKNPEAPPKLCVVCCAPAKFCGGKLSFRETCGAKCGAKLAQLRLLESSNGRHPSQTAEVKEKRKKTNLEKYGVTSPLLIEDVKKRRAAAMSDPSVISKIQRTCESRYGVRHPLQNASFLNKARQTNLLRFGAENAMQNRDIATKNKSKNSARYQELLLPAKVSVLRQLGFIEPFKNGYHGTGVSYTWEHSCGLVFDEVLPVNGGAPRCPECHKTSSHLEQLLRSRLEDEGIRTVQNVRDILFGKEIDIWLPEHNLGIEIHGEFWHSADARIQKKMQLAKDAKIQLLQFWGHEVTEKLDQVVSLVLAKIGKNTRISARKTHVIKLSPKEAHLFNLRHHLEGDARGASLSLGLARDDKLLMVATFCKSRFSKKHQFELLRMCSVPGVTVVGGASKLIKNAKDLLGVDKIITYANLRYSTGNVYSKLGMFLRNSKPNYTWYGYVSGEGWQKKTRYETQKHKLQVLLKDKFDPTKTEIENMLESNWLQLLDAGNAVYEL